eukprot:9790923-Prorocentrum_lima.AAC.1
MVVVCCVWEEQPGTRFPMPVGAGGVERDGVGGVSLLTSLKRAQPWPMIAWRSKGSSMARWCPP